MTCVIWILVMIWVASHHVSTGCQTGWFGSRCQYKCLCTRDNCDTDGLCAGSNTCLKGWFGPACQYADLAYNQASALTDGDDTTCPNDQAARLQTVPMSATFTWLRAVLAYSNSTLELKLRLKQRGSTYICMIRNSTVGMRIMDMHCPSNGTVQEVILSGSGIHYLCSIYISGGRNIALKQHTNQSSTYYMTLSSGVVRWYASDMAVDGNTESHFFRGETCTHTRLGYSDHPYWAVNLNPPGHVTRYLVYNRVEEGDPGATLRLCGFTLESFDVDNVNVFSYTDRYPTALSVYTIHNETVGVAVVRIRLGVANTPLTLCEVEVYGDSICQFGTYGMECDKICNCFINEVCSVSTGACPSGCAVGYQGEDCKTPCTLGQFGLRCEQTCSEFCVQNSQGHSACQYVTGKCLLGCELGYQAPNCVTECDADRYGQDCALDCSPACATPSKDTDDYCDDVDGSCLYGCDNGYYGTKCSVACMVNNYGKDCKLYCSEGCQPSPEEQMSPCDNINGSCLYGCVTGFNGSLCDHDMRLEISSWQRRTPDMMWPSLQFITIFLTCTAACALLIGCMALWFCAKKQQHPTEEEESN